MSIEITPIVRTFTYNGILLPDVPGLAPREVRDLYSAQFPELVSAEVEAGEVANGRQDFVFRKAVGTKGTGTHDAVPQAPSGPRLAALLERVLGGVVRCALRALWGMAGCRGVGRGCVGSAI